MVKQHIETPLLLAYLELARLNDRHDHHISFSFAIPTIIFLGSLYSSVSARFVFFRVFRESRHRHEHTAVAWAAWAGIIAATWVAAFVIAEVIPFFSDMLSLMSSLFDGWFG